MIEGVIADFVSQFLRPIPLEYAFVGVYVCLMLVGVIGNCLVVYVVLRNKIMREASINLYLGNLALADLLVLTVCLPPTIATDVTKTFWLGLGLLQVDPDVPEHSRLRLRWRAVTSPLSAPLWHTRRVIPCIWLTAAVLSLPEPFTLQIFPADYERPNLKTTWGTRCAPSWSVQFQQHYQLVQTILLFLFPLAIISGLCIHMSIILRRKGAHDRRAANPQSETGHSNLGDRHASLWALVPSGSRPQHSLVRKFIPRLFSYSASSLNPIVYSLSSGTALSEGVPRAVCFGRNQRKRDRRSTGRKSTVTWSGLTTTHNL
ncbi:hypothetical protein M3Y99_01162500 [Aphelenchoides fujianensis]|nr:hypothetical protein M3Y99_01162500 [Aphelenchoides fujianensis]